MELIDKEKVVVEIKRLRQKATELYGYSQLNSAYNNVLESLDNFETKEVDLEKEIYDAEKRFGDIDEMGGYRILIFDDEFRDILRHFFELGLKAKNEKNNPYEN